MLKKLCPLFIGFVLCGYVAISQKAIDSLENELKKPLNDSLRINKLVKLSEEYQNTDFKKSLAIVEEAISIGKKNAWKWAIAKGTTQKSLLHSIHGDYVSAISSDQELLKLAVEMGDSTRLASSLNFLGFDYQELGEFDEAYYYYTQTFRISVAIRDSTKIATSYINLGSIFKELGQYEESLSYLEQATKMSLLLKDTTFEPYILDEVGDVYQRTNQLSKSRKALEKSLAETRRQKIFVLEPEILQKLGKLSMLSNDLGSAFAYYDSALKIYSSTKNQFGIAQIKLAKGLLFLKQEKPDSAVRLTEESRAIARSLNARKAESDCLNQLAGLAESKNDFKKALIYYQASKALSDSIVSRETLARTFQNQLRFEADSKNLEIAELTNSSKKQSRAIKQEEFIRNILVVAMALTAVVLFTVYRSGQRRLRINKLLLEHQEEIKKRAIELEELNKVKDKFFSIISHDLRSPINSLSAILSLMENQGLQPDEFIKLSKELRLQFANTKTLINNLLDWALMQMDKLKMQPEKISLHQLAADNYKLLSSMQLKEITFNNHIDESHIGLADLNMISLVFRNLLMNSLKFTEHGGTISAESKEKGMHYEICISDNGVGISAEAQKLIFEKTVGYSTRGTANEKGTGLGLILCKEFVERNGGKIWVESDLGKGSKFYFTVPKAV